jgi:3-methylcrotonyl-CoA carboxylase alpha subunit
VFDRLLIANRGEIACRIIRTARRLGCHTIAVYSDADANAAHVVAADEAHRIGPPPARESYLSIEALLAAARRSRAQAIHPGYGFLSENAEFARACEDAGLVFVGPPSQAIEALGSKARARRHMVAAGVPVVPGYDGDDASPAALAAAAESIGFPLLVKATAGGGGKGMQVVTGPAELAAAVESVRRIAASAFGDDRVLLERYVERPRHVEVQVFGDRHGRVVHLFERDCSVQRRHQKVIEEAPAPALSPELRAGLCDAALRAARAVKYVNAGTVEFIVGPDGSYYFLEMNTRLQVEHPVTELVTRLDLVEWQLRVAAGEPLPLQQSEIRTNGHAFEARIYAEDPAHDFRPSTGRLTRLRLPADDVHVRLDTGVREGDDVPVDYDPLIAKLVVWDHTRELALRRLRRALVQSRVVGPSTNLGFLAAIAQHEVFGRGPVDTTFLAAHRAGLLPAAEAAPDQAFALAALAVVHERHAAARALAPPGGDPHSPWRTTCGWRLNDEHHEDVLLRDEHREVSVRVRYRPEGFLLDLPSGPIRARADVEEDGHLHVDLDGARRWAMIVRQGEELTVLTSRESWRLFAADPAVGEADDAARGGLITAPMPGRIVRLSAAAGARVERGAPLLVLEAMKMEHTVVAPADGVVVAVHCAEGDRVAEGAELLEFHPGEGT